jgi:hypothetical protein
MLLLLFAAVLSTLVVAAPAGPASAATGPFFYRTMQARQSWLDNDPSSQCIDVQSENNVNVQLWRCSGAVEQDWRFEFFTNSGGVDWYRIINRKTQWCLGISGNSLNLSAPAVMSPCQFDTQHLSQLWSFTSFFIGNDPWTTVHNLWSGYCLDARGNATANRTVIQQYQCNGTNAQIWFANSGKIV